MTRRRRSRSALYIGALLWIALTVSLASWWMVFGLEEARQLSALSDPAAVRLSRVQRMLVWEGSSFIGLLVVGGIALVIAIRREQMQQRAVEAFFMAFTHDLKTALGSLQLQAESLREDLPAAADNPNLSRLLDDTVRLGVQLENSLYFAQPDGRLLFEPVAIAPFIRHVAADWPGLTVRIDGDAVAVADTRGLESVLRNLLQNAVVHGGATEVDVRVERSGDRVTLTARDNGRGATTEVLRSLGEAFGRRSSTGKTGVGLFVSRHLAQRMRGDLRFASAPGSGFTAVLDLPIP